MSIIKDFFRFKFILIVLLTIMICWVFTGYFSPTNLLGTNLASSAGSDLGFSEERFALQRKSMVKYQIIARGVKDKEVLDAMENVPRHLFVPKEYREYSYYDHPLPIGLDQTISQPYIVALMTEMLDVNKHDIVLEIGTGSGYQAAVLSEIVKEVYSIEIIGALGRRAEKQLKDIGYDNVNVRIGNGYLGWPEFAPFDGIIVTAAAGKIPDPLVEQLKPGAKMVIPVDNSSFGQDLLLVEKDANGKVNIKKTLPVRFVPLVEGDEVSK